MKQAVVACVKKCLEFVNHPSLKRISRVEDQGEATLLLLANMQVENQKKNSDLRFADAEFRVFSQWGEDGLIQYLINRVPIENRTFVEFGVGDYMESNTRFLLIHDNWRGLIIDGNAKGVEKIKRENLYWRHDLTALCEFITRDNINQLIEKRFRGDIGLLSIDIDGNDYWIWEAIMSVQPRIVICEYNSVFGANKAVSVPYDAAFSRTEAHFSNLYFGASLAALRRLAAGKGYVFVGCTKAGNDAFFVRKDLEKYVAVLDASDGYIESAFRESRDGRGELTFLSGQERLRAISGLEVFDFDANRLVKIADCFS